MVKYKFDGKERRFRFDFLAIAEWCEMRGITVADMSRILENITLISFCELCYWAYKSANPNDSDVTVDTVKHWINSDPPSFGKLMNAMNESDFMSPVVDNDDDDGDGDDGGGAKKKTP